MRVFLKVVLACLVLALLAGGFILSRLIEPEALRNTLTAQLSTALGRPVSIARLDLRLLPQPAVVIDQLETTLSDHPDDRLRLGRISATLSVPALLERQILISRLDVDSLALNPRLVDTLRTTLVALGRGTAGSAVAVRLRQAQVDGLVWTTANGVRLGPLNATLDLADDGLPEHITVTQNDGRLQADLHFKDQAVDLHLQARSWITPVHPPLQQALQVTTLEAHARYTDRRVELLDMNFIGPVGALQLNGVLEWRKDWHFAGKLNADYADLPLLLASLGQRKIAGNVTGACAIELRADTAKMLLRYPALDCALQHTDSGHTANINLVTRAETDALRYELHAANLRLPLGPPLQFDKLDLRGALTAGQITFDTARAEGYAGELELPGHLSWHSGWQWSFTAHAKRLQLDPLLAVFEQRTLDGRLTADCTGKLSAATPAALLTQPRLDCDFALTDGVLRSTDLEQAARLFKTSSKTAGTTPFEHLGGRLALHAGQARFTGLTLRSTALEASGSVTVAADRRLSGDVKAGLKNTGGMVSVPLVVSGTVGEPLVRPTTSAMAGGAAGTVLLGPGLGTAVGVKVGEAFGKMTRWLRPKDSTARSAAK